MCEGVGGRPIPCEDHDETFVTLCQAEVDRQLERIYDAHPILRTWVAKPGLPRCCQRDEIAEAAGWSAAWAWDDVLFLRGGS